MTTAKTESLRLELDRSANIRSIIKRFYIFVVLALIVLAFSVMKLDQGGIFDRGHFLSPDSIINLLRSAVPILTLSGAFTLLMISGHIDLSVGSAMSLSAVVYAWMVLNGYSFLPAFVTTLIMGCGLGFLNGYLVTKLRITPVIATLVTLSAFKGLALLIVPDGLSAIKGGAGQVMPDWINYYPRREVFLGLPWAFWIAVFVIILLTILQRRTLLGKYAAAIGGNRLAAELSGINAVRMVWLLYIIVGFFAALAGLARASYMSLGDPLSGDGMELDCIIAVLLGGTAFSGGEGSVSKTVVGALIIICVTIGLMTVIPAYWQVVAKGTVLVTAVVLNHLLVQDKVKAENVWISRYIMFKMPVGLYEKALPASMCWEERLTAAGQAGYDFVEISIDESDERLSRLDWPASERTALRRSIANSGVQIMTMCLSGHRKYPLGSHAPELRRQGRDILRKAIEFAGDVGLRVVQVMAYDVFYETSDDDTQANFMEGLEHGTRWAGQCGVMLGLENLDTPFVDSIRKALAVTHEIDSPWLHLYPDIGNLAAAGYCPPDELILAKGQLLGVHIKDALPRIIRGVPFGDGIVPFRDTFRALVQAGFWGLLGVEMWGTMHMDQDPLASITAARKFVDCLVNESWPTNDPYTACEK